MLRLIAAIQRRTHIDGHRPILLTSTRRGEESHGGSTVRRREARSAVGADTDLVMAALLHGVMEDRGVTRDELNSRFGAGAANLVAEATDDKSLKPDERKRLQVANAPKKPVRAQSIKLADKISAKSIASDQELRGGFGELGSGRIERAPCLTEVDGTVEPRCVPAPSVQGCELQWA